MESKKHLVEKLFNSECTRQELLLLLAEMNNKKYENYSDIMNKLWYELERYPKLDNDHSLRIYEKVLTKIDKDKIGNSRNSNLEQTELMTLKPRHRRFLLKVIAAFFVLCLGAFTWQWIQKDNTITIQTAYAVKDLIRLPDGSLVELRPNSEIKYHED